MNKHIFIMILMALGMQIDLQSMDHNNGNQNAGNDEGPSATAGSQMTARAYEAWRSEIDAMRAEMEARVSDFSIMIRQEKRGKDLPKTALGMDAFNLCTAILGNMNKQKVQGKVSDDAVLSIEDNLLIEARFTVMAIENCDAGNPEKRDVKLNIVKNNLCFLQTLLSNSVLINLIGDAYKYLEKKDALKSFQQNDITNFSHETYSLLPLLIFPREVIRAKWGSVIDANCGKDFLSKLDVFENDRRKAREALLIALAELDHTHNSFPSALRPIVTDYYIGSFDLEKAPKPLEGVMYAPPALEAPTS